MAKSIITLSGADVKLYISDKLFPEVQSISYQIDYGEMETYGIDSAFPQEISTSRVLVRGTVAGLRIKLSGGLQGRHARPLLKDILNAPYISLEIRIRETSHRLLWVPQVKITNERVTIDSRGVYKITFGFKGIIPYNTLDLYR